MAREEPISVKSMWTALKRKTTGTWRNVVALGERISVSRWILAISLLSLIFSLTPLFFLAGLGPILAWWLINHRNPPIQPIPKLKNTVIPGRDGFNFYPFKENDTPEWMPEWMKPLKDESALIWEGFGMGVLKSTGKVEVYAIYLYGSNEGVGHYSFRARSDKFSGSCGEGHFNLMPFEKGSDSWEWRVRSSAGERLSRHIAGYSRPLQVSYDEQSGTISMYDPESGRDVYPNKNRSGSLDDLFVFGPYPKKLDGIYGKPGTIVSVANTPSSASGLHLHARDIYGRPVEHVMATIRHAESGYQYKQTIGGEGIFVTLPEGLSNVHVLINRGGYGELETEVELTDGSQRIDAILEPLR